MLKTFNDIIDAVKEGGVKRLVIPDAAKTDMQSLEKAAGAGLIIPSFVGDGKEIEDVIKGTSLKSLEHEIIDEKDPDKALSASILSIREGRADILMQGGANHQALIDAVMDAKTVSGRESSRAIFQSFNCRSRKSSFLSPIHS